MEIFKVIHIIRGRKIALHCKDNISGPALTHLFSLFNQCIFASILFVFIYARRKAPFIIIDASQSELPSFSVRFDFGSDFDSNCIYNDHHVHQSTCMHYDVLHYSKYTTIWTLSSDRLRLTIYIGLRTIYKLPKSVQVVCPFLSFFFSFSLKDLSNKIVTPNAKLCLTNLIIEPLNI